MISQLSHRSIIQYDELLGHKYIPNLKVRVKHPDGPYFLETDGNGFRNTTRGEGKIKVLVIGDSFAAGDGVSNKYRFSDIIESKLDVTVYNYAVSGTGVDQQYLIAKQYYNEINPDIIILAPHLDDLNRNLLPERKGLDRVTGKHKLIPKPYFELDANGNLDLKNVPVPYSIDILDEKHGDTTIDHSPIKVKLSKAKNVLKDIVNKDILKHESNPNLSDANSREWKLMGELIKAFKDLHKGKPLFIVPLPESEYIQHKLSPKYLEIYSNLLGDTHNVLDIIPVLESVKKQGKKMFLSSCGHFTKESHHAIADFMIKVLLDRRLVSSKGDVNDESEDKHEYVLGISCLYHDSACALLKSGEIIAAAQEERFTRVKHDKSFPENAINYCLEEAGIQVEDLKGICYYDNEALTLERAFTNALSLGEYGLNFWQNNEKSLYMKLLINSMVKRNLGYKGKVYKTEHHRSHAASAFYPSPYESAAIVTVDGVGEWATSTIGKGTKDGIKMLRQQNYPHSIGLLYSAFTFYCGFKVNSGEYKLMGLAPYGEPKYTDLITDKLIRVFDDGSIELDLSYFSFQEGKKMVNEKFETLFGEKIREGESHITQFYMDMAASIQIVTEEVMLKLINYAHELTGEQYLVLAGGVALNCVANGKLLKKGPFKDIWIQPAAGDAGGALGAAYELYFSQNKNAKLAKPQEDTFFGPSYSNDEILAFLGSKGYTYHKFGVEERGATIASFLGEGKVVGHFNGRMEFGPRSLGSRSIIADPRNSETQSTLNLKIKFRESFRPFAPAVLESHVSEYFDIDRKSPYMLLVAPVHESKRLKVKEMDGDNMIDKLKQVRSDIPAITHVDYSARIQTVTPNENGFHDIIKSFYEQTECPVIVNTSFNVRGEPIVCTPLDAYRCFMRTHMDILVLGDFYLIKEEQPKLENDINWEETFVLD